MTVRLLAGAAALAAAIGGFAVWQGSRDNNATMPSSEREAAQGALRDADQVLRDQRSDKAAKSRIGTEVKVGVLQVSITSVRLSRALTGSEADPDVAGYVVASVSTANPTGKEEPPVNFDVVCSNHDTEGYWTFDSTYQMNAVYPPESVRTGDLEIGVPHMCEGPSIRATQTGLALSSQQDAAAEWPIPAEVVAAIAG